MDRERSTEQAKISPADLLTGADHVEPLPGLTASVPDDRVRQADLPIGEMAPNTLGQFVPIPVVMPAQSQRLVFLRTLMRSPKARVGAAIVLFFILMAALAPVIAPGDPAAFSGAINAAPSAEHILGTETQGGDVYMQTVWGARGSLAVGFGTAALAVLVAVVIGLTAAYFRGRIDDILTLIMNLFLVIPGLPLLIALSVYLQPTTSTVIFALTFTGWAYVARIIRAQALSVREKEFVAATVVAGESDRHIIFREILPNLVNIIVGSFLGTLVYGISAATALAFLGLTDTQEVTWGTNLFRAQNGGALMVGSWWSFIPSGLCVAIVAFGLSLINYGMDEVTNPRLRAERELKNVVKDSRQRRVRATPVVPRPH
ncbi:MAG: ABC transporter permease [Chloroflexia bacterium]